MHGVAVAAVAAVAIGLLTLLAEAGGFPNGRPPPALPQSPALPNATLPAERPDRTGQREEPVRRMAGLVQRRTVLRAAPGGRRIATMGPTTRFGGRQSLAVVARRGDWLAVLHPRMPNGRAGWIPRDAVSVVRARWEIEIDRSERVARVRYDGRFAARFGVAVGRPSSPTPVGRFAITDRIRTRGSSPYGCCILALSGRQGRLPQGWTGGDRLALHGSPSDAVGGSVSSGCVRMRERHLRWLMRRVPVGTRVDVRA